MKTIMINENRYLKLQRLCVELLQIRTSKDGSKTQVVREYGCNTSSANDPKQNVSYQQDSYVYINGPKGNLQVTSSFTHYFYLEKRQRLLIIVLNT